MIPTGPLFKWFGSKWSAAKLYPTPRYGMVIEPFAGGAGYSLRYASLQIVICETDPHILALWQWLIREATESAIRDIPTGLTEGTDIRAVGLSEGQALLLKSWQRTNSVGDCWTVSPWGNKPGQWTKNTRARVANEFGAVSHWRVADDALGMMRTGIEATWFIDPPYQYNYGYRQAKPDYAELGTAVSNLPGQVIACEAVCPKSGATPNWLPFSPFASRVTSRRKAHENHHSNELLWVRP